MGVPVPRDAIKDDDDMCEVWASNWSALTAFLAVETQWRIITSGAGAAIWLGLDYAAVDVALKRRGFDDDAFIAVQEMERAALDVFARAG